MLPLAIDGITFADIQRVLPDLRESKTLDFKRELSIRSKEEKLEFAADVSAFANSSGGDLVYGVSEEGGAAVDTNGIVLEDPEREILRLEQILRASLEPVITGLRLVWVRKRESAGLLVVRVPKSWSAPHRVIANSRFYGRNSAGKYPLDVAELRSAFVYGNEVAERIRRFRLERAYAIASNEGALPTKEGAKVVLHLVPLSSFAGTIELALSRRTQVPILGRSGYNPMPVLEGMLNHSGADHDDSPVGSYTLLYRTGIIEAVIVEAFEEQGRKFISLPAIEDALASTLPSYISLLETQGVTCPLYLFLSVVGASGYHPWTADSSAYRAARRQQRDQLLLPELVLDDFSCGSAGVLRPLFDRLANTFGFEQSLTYRVDEQ